MVNGTNSTQSAVACKACSEGMVCDQQGLNWTQIVPKAGYMPMINTEPESLQMMTCINNECIGGENGNEPNEDGYYCTDYHTGVLCTDCEDGYGKTGGHICEVCPPPAVNAVRSVGLMLMVMLIIVLFIRATIKSALKAKSDLSTIGKIGFSFIQFNSLALQFDYEFPDFVEVFLEV